MLAVAEFGSVADAARLFGVGEYAIRSGVADGSLPHVKVGRFIRLPLRQIVEQARQHETPEVEAEGSVNDYPAVGVRYD